jgi:hypothetical protein
MKRKRHSPEQIVRKLREADMKTDAVKRLRDLEKENARLKKAVADLTLDKQILKEALGGNTEPGAEASSGAARAAGAGSFRMSGLSSSGTGTFQSAL